MSLRRLPVFPTMQPWFTKAIDGKTAKRLLFSSVLVLSTDLKVANVISVVIIVNSVQILIHQKIIMIFTEHPFEASKFTLTPLVHFDFLGLQLGTTLGERSWIISEHFYSNGHATMFQFVCYKKKKYSTFVTELQSSMKVAVILHWYFTCMNMYTWLERFTTFYDYRNA